MSKTSNIINEKQLRQITNCGFVHAIIVKPKHVPYLEKLKEDKLNMIVKCIKVHDKLTRLEILKKIEMSSPTFKKYLGFLVESGEVKRNANGGSFEDRTFSATSKARLVY